MRLCGNTAVATLLLLAGCAKPTTSGGIVSVNPCADALLVRLVASERIAAISHYSQTAGATSIPLDLARRFRATAGTAEEVIALRPSLVLASTFTPPATRDAYARAGLRVLLLDAPATVAGSVAQVRRVAAAVGEGARGEAIARAIEATLKSSPGRGGGPSRSDGGGGSARSDATARSSLHHAVPRPGEEPSALLFLSGDLANGGGTLLDELMRSAGLRNAAADYGLSYTGRVPLEVLAARPPAIIIAPDRRGRAATMRRRLLPGIPEATFPRALINCGGPAIVPALARLHAIRAALP